MKYLIDVRVLIVVAMMSSGWLDPAHAFKRFEHQAIKNPNSNIQGAATRSRWYSPSGHDFVTPGSTGFGNNANHYGLGLGDSPNRADKFGFGAR
jgi:hypothetical protein